MQSAHRKRVKPSRGTIAMRDHRKRREKNVSPAPRAFTQAPDDAASPPQIDKTAAPDPETGSPAANSLAQF
jgi:hypothetical protein